MDSRSGDRQPDWDVFLDQKFNSITGGFPHRGKRVWEIRGFWNGSSFGIFLQFQDGNSGVLVSPDGFQSCRYSFEGHPDGYVGPIPERLDQWEVLD